MAMMRARASGGSPGDPDIQQPSGLPAAGPARGEPGEVGAETLVAADGTGDFPVGFAQQAAGGRGGVARAGVDDVQDARRRAGG